MILKSDGMPTMKKNSSIWAILQNISPNSKYVKIQSVFDSYNLCLAKPDLCLTIINHRREADSLKDLVCDVLSNS